jgi:hypothetical protein
MAMIGRRRRVLAALAILGLGLGLAPSLPSATALAASGVTATFGAPSGTSAFGRELRFEQPVTIVGNPARVEALVTLPGAEGPLVVDETDEAASGVLDYRLDTSNGALLPNTVVTVRWRVVAADGSSQLGPETSVRYVDDRFDWRTEAGRLVTIHWYQGDDAFGHRALSIAEDGVAQAERLFGTTETRPIDFFVYSDQAAFYDALGPGTRENVGGEAIPEIRTMFALITPSELNADWVHVVIPHELTHLVFDTTVRNPYHAPPRWLNEGLAVYLSQGYVSSDRGRIRDAVGGGTLMPLTALGGQFPTTSERFYLAYAESVSAVDFLIRSYGRDALVSLVRSYATGRSDDEAFQAGLGVNVRTFERAWLADLGASEASRAGPQPDPGGPVPSDWTSGGADGGPAAPSVVPPAAPASGGAGAPLASAGSAGPVAQASSGIGPAGFVALGAAGLVAVIALGVGLASIRRGRGGTRPGPDGPRAGGGDGMPR